MIGGAGNDVYHVDNLNDLVAEVGGDGEDEVYASASWTLTPGADVETVRTHDLNEPINLTGNSTGNLVRGNAGSNILNGGGGNDELIGLGGQDTFLFNTQLDPAAHAVLSDFNVVDEVIQLDDAIFTSLASGTLAGSEFLIGRRRKPTTSSSTTDSGAIFYDSDGSGAAAAIHFAQVGAGLAMTNFNFFVV